MIKLPRKLRCYIKVWDDRRREWRLSCLPWRIWLWGRFTGEIAPSSICDTGEERFYNMITIPRSKLIFD